jgi:uncharacterized protein YjbJ (UPF0337 family)
VNWEQTKKQWNQAKGALKKQLGKLTDDDLTVIAGQRNQLVGKIQERYGIAKEEADKQVKTWESMKVNEPEDVRSEEERKASSQEVIFSRFDIPGCGVSVLSGRAAFRRGIYL